MGSGKRVAIVLMLGLLASRAAAQPPADLIGDSRSEEPRTREARELFLRGAGLTRAGRWQEALTVFERSFGLRPHAGTLYNIGYCERALGRTTRARKAFTQALERNALQASDELSGELLRATKRYLAEVDERIVKVNVRLTPPDVRIAVDGRPLEVVAGPGERLVVAAGTRAPGPGEPVLAPRFELWVDPGNHVFVLSRDRAGKTALDHSFAPGQRGELELAWDPPALRPEPVAVAAAHDPGSAQRGWAIGVGAAGLAVLAVGGVLGGVAADTWGEAQDACPTAVHCPDTRGAELSADARQLGNLATAALVTGSSALVGATLLWLTAPAAREPASAPSVAGVAVRWRLALQARPQGAVAGVSASF